MTPPLFALWAGLALAGNAAGPAPPPPWDLKVGISYVATTGNTETSTAGWTTRFARDGKRWTVEGDTAAERSAQKRRLRAERYQAHLRARRKLKSVRLRWTAGLAAERNRFAGLDLRTVLDTSLAWTLREGPQRRLQGLAGLTLTREDRLRGARRAAIGGLLQATGGLKLSPTAELGGELSYFPNFDDLADNRVTAKLTLGAALTRHLGLEVGYDWRYDNRPVPGFGKTDATATTAVVVRLGKGS